MMPSQSEWRGTSDRQEGPDLQGEDISVTVIGGYLGAGKTTLVNHILRTATERIAVLVNDFGEINIDSDLIESEDGDTISLANGCICCSLVDGFSAALNTIKELDPQPDRLVIEASGVADPASVAAYGHSPGLTLDAVVVVADAETIRNKSRDKYVGDTVVGQLRSADILILNKVDLVERATVDATREWLLQFAPEAVVIEASESQVSPTVLFGVLPKGSGAGRAPDHTAAHEHADDHATAEDVFESWNWSSATPIARRTVEGLMEAMPDTVVRAKGLVLLSDEPDRAMVLQRVGKRWTLRPGGQRPEVAQIVFIGMRGAIDDRWIAEQLSSQLD